MKKCALKVLERLPDDKFLCHGDFHPDQIIMSPKGPIVIDWITAIKGSPASDVAQSSLVLRLGAPPAGRASGVADKSCAFLRPFQIPEKIPQEKLDRTTSN